MNKNHEILDLSYLEASFGNEPDMITALIEMGTIQLSESINIQKEIKATGNYYLEWKHRLYYTLKGTVVMFARQPEFDWEIIRRYTMLGYFNKARSVKELHAIHKLLYCLVYGCKNVTFEREEPKKNLKNLLFGDAEEFYKICESLPEATHIPEETISSWAKGRPKYQYYFTLLNDMYAVSTDEEMKNCLAKYDKLAQENLDIVLTYLGKLHEEVKAKWEELRKLNEV